MKFKVTLRFRLWKLPAWILDLSFNTHQLCDLVQVTSLLWALVFLIHKMGIILELICYCYMWPTGWPTCLLLPGIVWVLKPNAPHPGNVLDKHRQLVTLCYQAGTEGQVASTQPLASFLSTPARTRSDVHTPGPCWDPESGISHWLWGVWPLPNGERRFVEWMESQPVFPDPALWWGSPSLPLYPLPPAWKSVQPGPYHLYPLSSSLPAPKDVWISGNPCGTPGGQEPQQLLWKVSCGDRKPQIVM